MCSADTLSVLRSDSYVDLSQYRDQHFRVSGAPPPPLLLTPRGVGAARDAWAGPGCRRVTLSLRLRGRGMTRSGC